MSGSRTPFAGYERLAPGDPLSEDGYAFQFQNPVIADRLGKLGAVTHRHDAHAAMVDPTTAPTVVTAATGGSIPASTPIHVVYTLTDPDGGETLPVSAIVVTTAAGYLTPAAPPTVAVDYTAGTLLAGTPLYAITVTDGAGGETALGPAASLTIDPGHANARAQISGLTALTNASSGSSVAASWRLWKSVDGGSTWNLMGTGAYSVNTFTDSGAAGNCTVSPPRTGTTVGTNKLTVTVPATSQPAEATFFSIYASVTGQFLTPSLLGTYPVSDFGSAKVYTALTLLNAQPPAVSSCYPGANQIDPATDILGGGGGSTTPLGVNRIALGTSPAIAASSTTTVSLTVPSWAEGSTWRLVVALCVTHPDASQLAATLNDPGSDGPVTLFSAGSFSAVANIGNPAIAPGDPDAPIYLSDQQYGNLFTDAGYIEASGRVITASSGLGPFGGLVYVPQSSINDVFSGVTAAGTWHLAITESGGSSGTLKAFAIYLISSEFDALATIPAPPGIGPWVALTPGTNATITAFSGSAIGRAALDGLGTTQIAGQVHLDGTVKATGAIGAGATFATLPSAAYHAAYDKYVGAVAQISAVMTNVILKVTSAGALSINAALATNDYVFLDGIALPLQS